MRVLCLSVLLAVAAAESEEGVSTPEGQPGKPILSTDLFHRTAELFYDVYDSVHGKFLKPHIDKHADTVTKSVASLTEVDVVGEACNVLKCDAKEVNQHVRTISSTAQGHANTAYSAALAFFAQVEEALTRYTHFVIDAFETALPKYTGLISRTPMNLMLFVSYIFFVMYVILKIFLFGLWLGLTILSCLCCCGCCCLRGKKGGKVADESKAKNGKTASKATEKGKAATNAPNNKQPPAKGKK
mmetsp:Transcript_118216/g.166172  ORF Transcript_118216/g.166172 Transcript_118216/m.166172 type:complete len:243 (+) Transcript_118216:66-794(+)